MDYRGAARQLGTDFRRPKMLVAGRAEPGLARDGNDRISDFAGLFGPAFSCRLGTGSARGEPHLSRNRGRADDSERE